MSHLSPKGNSSNNKSSSHSNAILVNSDEDFVNKAGLDSSGGIPAPTARYSSIYDQDYHQYGLSSNGPNRSCASYADRVLFSNKYYYAYIVMIILNLILILWLVINLIKKKTSVPSHWLFISLDIVVNIALFIEITLQIISQKKKYFQSWSNRFDLFVLLLSIAGLFMYLLSAASIAFDYEGIVIIFFTALRYFVQFARLLALIKRQQMRASTFNSRVDFNELKESDLVFDIDTSDF